MRSKFFLISILGVHVFLLFFLRFTAWPEMIAYPYLLNHGFSFYNDIIQPYFPFLSYFLLFWFRLFGFTPFVLQQVTIAIISITDILFFALLKKFFSVNKSIMLLLLFVILQIFCEGNGMWFDLVVTPFILSAVFFLIHFQKTKTNFWLVGTGIFVGLSFLIKQTSLWYEIGILLFLFSQRKLPAAIFFVIASLIPFVLLQIFFAPHNVLFWSIKFPFVIMPRLPGYILFPTAKQLFVTGFIFLPVVFLLKNILIKSKNRETEILFVLLTFTSLGFLYPRFAYFHLQPALPFVVMLFGFVFAPLQGFRLNRVIASVYVLGIIVLFLRFTQREALMPVRFFEPHVVNDAVFLKEHITNEGPVFFYNVPANYMVAGDLIPTKPWADTFPWYLEYPGIQEKIIENLNNQNVNSVIFSPFLNGNRFALGSYKPEKIDYFIQQNFSIHQPLGNNLMILRR